LRNQDARPQEYTKIAREAQKRRKKEEKKGKKKERKKKRRFFLKKGTRSPLKSNAYTKKNVPKTRNK